MASDAAGGNESYPGAVRLADERDDGSSDDSGGKTDVSFLICSKQRFILTAGLLASEGCGNNMEAEADKEPETEEEEPETEEIIYTRNKKKPGTLDEMLKGLPVREEQHALTEEELTEIFGENGWKQLPDEIYRKLEYHPATKEVVEHHIAVYAAKKEDRIVRATHPVELLNHSIATPSLVAAVMNGKYTNAMPLYRIAQEMERTGVKIPVPTLANWVIRCSERYLSLVEDRLHMELKGLPVV